MTIKMSHKELDITTNSKSTVVAALVAQINEAGQVKAVSAEQNIPQNLFTSEGLQVSATAPKTELGRKVASDMLNQIAIATSPKSLQEVSTPEASDKSVETAVKGLDFSWAKNVGGSKGEKTFAELAVKSNNGWGMGA